MVYWNMLKPVKQMFGFFPGRFRLSSEKRQPGLATIGVLRGAVSFN